MRSRAARARRVKRVAGAASSVRRGSDDKTQNCDKSTGHRMRPLGGNGGCGCSSTARFATGPKRSMGHFLGAKKIIFSVGVLFVCGRSISWNRLLEIYLNPVVSKDRADTTPKGARPKPRPSRRTAPRPGARTRRGPCDPRDGRSDQRRPILPGEQDLASRRIRRLARRATGRSPPRRRPRTALPRQSGACTRVGTRRRPKSAWYQSRGLWRPCPRARRRGRPTVHDGRAG